jgi:Domain of unknown function (DUF5658)
MSSIVYLPGLTMHAPVRPSASWVRRSLAFGNLAIVAFLVAQALDGIFTYIGLVTYGPAVEGNPLLSWLMASVGAPLALTGAKLAASAFGIILHLSAVHRTVALLAMLYVSAAILPWVELLYFAR